MKKKYAFLLFLCFQLSFSQYGNVSTIAGDGSQGYSGDGGPATSAVTNFPSDVVIDNSGNIYFSEITNCVVRKIATDGTITTVAGVVGNCSFDGDGGPANVAKLDFPSGLGVDANGNLYISDRNNHRIRKVATNGIITTVAGNGTDGDSGDGGQATAANLDTPTDVAVDATGNIYISDWYNHKIRKINTSGVISTYAGTGDSGFSGDNGLATAAKLKSPDGIAVDADGNVYFSDRSNDRIRKISTSGIITTVAGKGGFNAFSGDGGQATDAEFNDPNGIALDATGNIYVVDRDNHRVRKIGTDGIINTIVGTGTTGYSGGGYNGDGQIGTATLLNKPTGIAIDNSGNVIFADYNNHRIRKLASSSLSVNNFSKNIISFYPNPISGDQKLTIESKENISEISILNSTGQVVNKVTVNSDIYSASMDNLSKGIYFVKLSNDKNQSTTYKLVKN
ncbi:T9SS type A sorting domain-containing protein [Algibacter sp. L1A34]|uniref:NHL domain-containing protein n=1 Tax=Algibacter sp. L1A34 TaxID=2686365 RepID=UPI00131E8088|nr:T9SS type A sorting domain-containing protein [Algibacter sp. L1A34]